MTDKRMGVIAKITEKHVCPLCGGPWEVPMNDVVSCINLHDCPMPPVPTQAWKALSEQKLSLEDQLLLAREGLADCLTCKFLGRGDPKVDEVAAIKEENAALRRAFVLAYQKNPEEVEDDEQE